MKKNIAAIIVAAGEGRRLGKKEKPLLKLAGKPLFYYSVEEFCKIKAIKKIILVLKLKNIPLARRLLKNPKLSFVEGGLRRQDSVYNGIVALQGEFKYIIVHDAARPFVKKELILKVIKELKKYPAVICGLPVNDTLKKVVNKEVRYTLPRDNIYQIQTPQGFRLDYLMKSYSHLKKQYFTDEASLLERINKRIKVIEGDVLNFKITYPYDIKLARMVLKANYAGE